MISGSWPEQVCSGSTRREILSLDSKDSGEPLRSLGGGLLLSCHYQAFIVSSSPGTLSRSGVVKTED